MLTTTDPITYNHRVFRYHSQMKSPPFHQRLQSTPPGAVSQISAAGGSHVTQWSRPSCLNLTSPPPLPLVLTHMTDTEGGSARNAQHRVQMSHDLQCLSKRLPKPGSPLRPMRPVVALWYGVPPSTAPPPSQVAPPTAAGPGRRVRRRRPGPPLASISSISPNDPLL